jgi:hypothetical protein
VLASYLLTIIALIVVQRAVPAWIGHGTPPAPAWAVALVVPAADLILGLLLLGSGRPRLARAPLFSGVVLAAFAAWTVWGWR